MTTNKEAKGPYTITSTIPENEYIKYRGNYQQFGQSSSGFWDVSDIGSDNSATACTEKPEEVKDSDISYEEYMRVIHENEILKQIIIELNVLLFKEKK